MGCATVGPPVYQPLYLSAGAYRPAALRRSPSTGNTGKIKIIRHILQTSEFNNYTGVHKVLCSTENSLFYQCPKLCNSLCCIKLRQHCKSKVLKKILKLFHVIYNIKSNKMRYTVLESAKRPPCNFRQIFIP